MPFRVESGVPRNHGARVAWPFKDMGVDESFALPADPVLIRKCRLAAGAYSYQRKGVRFSVRKQADGTARCWRLA